MKQKGFTPHQICSMYHHVYSKGRTKIANQRFGAGFTFIEILVVVGIIVLFLGLSIPQLRSFQQGSYLKNTGQEVVAALRLAQSKTLASEGALQYGVHFDVVSTPNQYTLFQGSSYAARDTAKDKITVLQKTIEISSLSLGGTSEVVFLRLTGQASVSGTVTFRKIADPTLMKTVSILSSGAVQEGTATLSSDEDRVVDSRHVHVSYSRTIDTATESIRLVFPDTTFSFTIASNMSGGEILWEGDVVSEEETQHLKIHTHFINFPVNETLFSLHRDLRYNTETLSIELSGDVVGDNLISYANDPQGTVTRGTSVHVQTAPELQ